jgi:hypothetical protein
VLRRARLGAARAAFLAGPHGDFIGGQESLVDGGRALYGK